MSLALPAGALADGRSVLADFEDNGQIDGCYSLADYDEALTLVGPGDAQYGALADVIQLARVTNVERPGEPCAQSPAITAPPTAGVAGETRDADGSPVVWLMVAIGAVIGLAGGAWAFLRRSGRRS